MFSNEQCTAVAAILFWDLKGLPPHPQFFLHSSFKWSAVYSLPQGRILCFSKGLNPLKNLESLLKEVKGGKESPCLSTSCWRSTEERELGLPLQIEIDRRLSWASGEKRQGGSSLVTGAEPLALFPGQAGRESVAWNVNTKKTKSNLQDSYIPGEHVSSKEKLDLKGSHRRRQ